MNATKPAVLDNDTRTPLTLMDRCDKCSSQAFIRTTKNDLTLLFCGHHGRANAEALTLQDFRIEDFTDSINEKPSPSV